MDSSTAHIASTATGMDIGTARPDKRQLWVDLQAQVHSAKTTQDCDDDTPDQDTIDEIEAEIDRVQARQVELESQRVAMEDAADNYGPGANYDANDEAL